MLRILILFFIFAQSFANYAEGVNRQQTKAQLEAIDHKIIALKETLAHANDKRRVLHDELSGTEKKISSSVQNQRTIQQEIGTKEQTILTVQTEMNKQSESLAKQRQLLARHLVTCYQLGNHGALKLLLAPPRDHRLNQLLTYYRYLIQSRQQLISSLNETIKKLNENKLTLQDAILKQQELKQTLEHERQALQEHKQYQTTILTALGHEIQNQEQRLQEFEQNKKNLSHLVTELSIADEKAKPKPIPEAQPFQTLKHKLPKPISIAHLAMQPRNQGVTFFAGEGTPVHAVYSGKVVFSDWLNGYGLLIIIDHGHGFMTLYANNQALLKSKGTIIHTGEQIATVGHSGGLKENGLYFEVRERGKAVSPLLWLA